MSESERISRRNYLKIAAGAAVAVAIGAGGYYWYLTSAPKPSPSPSPTPTPKPTATPTGPTPTPTPTPTPPPTQVPTIRYLGHPFYFPEDAVPEVKKALGLDVEATYEDFFILAQRQLADPSAWDIGGSGRHRPLVAQGILLPIPAEKVPRWQEDKTLEIFNNPEKYYTPKQAERFNTLLWFEPGKTFASVPVMWNFDSVTYLPEFVPYEEHGGEKTTLAYSEIWNPEWKGRTAMQDEAFTVFSETANELEATGQIGPLENISGLSNEEVDQVFNFLLPIVKSGQIKTFWFKYGDIVNLLATREVYMASTWQPPCFDCRKAGTPAYYARLVNGPFFWWNGLYLSKEGNPAAREACYQIANWCLELWIQMLYTRQGYPTPVYKWNDYKEAMGDEFYNWFFEGKATYLPIDEIMKEIWPDNPEFADLEERLQQALFLPDVYFRHFWTGESPRTGSPHPKGNLRDIGSVKDKEEITRFFLSPDLPDNNDYYVHRYEELKANLPV